MPELPEVETVRRALTPVMEGAVFKQVICNRKNLRFDFPKNFSKRLKGARVNSLSRRGKYMLAELSTAEVLIMHLGMSGRFTVRGETGQTPGDFHHSQETKPAHDHVIFKMCEKGSQVPTIQIIYNDPRRFGFMDLVPRQTLEECRHFQRMGPEPLGNQFSEDVLFDALIGKKTPIKQALLDQRNVAGLGNIYVCEALFRSGISPKRAAGRISRDRVSRLTIEVRKVLEEAIEAGGASLKDFASSDGSPGYFQHDFQIYDREGQPCHSCGAEIRRIVQGGRSSFYCTTCQK